MKKLFVCLTFLLLFTFAKFEVTDAEEWITLDESALKQGIAKGKTAPNKYLELSEELDPNVENVYFKQWKLIEGVTSDKNGNFEFKGKYSSELIYSIKSEDWYVKYIQFVDKTPNDITIENEDNLNDLNPILYLKTKAYTYVQMYVDNKHHGDTYILANKTPSDLNFSELTPGQDIKFVFKFRNGEVKEKHVKFNASVESLVIKPENKVTNTMNYFVLPKMNLPTASYYKYTIKNQSGKVISKETVYDRKKGRMKIKMEKQPEGSYVYITAKDKWGNESRPSKVLIRDGVPPKISLNSKNIYNSTTKISGKGEPNAVVEITSESVQPGTQLTVMYQIGQGKINSKGQFTINIPRQAAGMKVKVYAYDKEGNISPKIVKNVQDNIPPSPPKVSKVYSKSYKITGNSEKNSMIYVYQKGKFLGNGLTNKNGKFYVKLPKLKKGTKLSVSAVDDAGNESKPRYVTVK